MNAGEAGSPSSFAPRGAEAATGDGGGGGDGGGDKPGATWSAPGPDDTGELRAGPSPSAASQSCDMRLAASIARSGCTAVGAGRVRLGELCVCCGRRASLLGALSSRNRLYVTELAREKIRPSPFW